MRSRVAGLGLLLALAGCQAEPRSADYFAAHETDALAVQTACTKGDVRGAECDNADEGLRTIAGKRAMGHVEQQTTGGQGLAYKRK